MNDEVDENAPTSSSEPASADRAARPPANARAPVAVLALGIAVAAILLDAGLVAAACAAGLSVLVWVRGDDGYRPPHSYGLPGVPDGPPRTRTVPAAAHLGTIAAAALVIGWLALLRVPWWTFVVVLAVACVVTWLRASRAVRGRQHAARVVAALTAHAPTVALGYAGRSAAPWQLRMWEPYVVASGEPTVVVNLDEKYLPMILQEAGLSSPLVQVGSRGSADLDDLLVPSLRAMFYVQNARRNDDFLAHAGLTHVWLNHGDSDKPASFSAQHDRYDLLVVAGPVGIERYARHGVSIAPHKFVPLGRPQTADIRPTSDTDRRRPPRTVLYAPTWQGVDAAVDFSSLERGPEIVRALLARDLQVVFRPHPLSYRWRQRRALIHVIRRILRHDAEQSRREHLWGRAIDHQLSLAECINVSDALIADVSGVVSDHLASGKPYAIVSRLQSPDQLRGRSEVAAAGYVVEADLGNLDAVLDDLLGDDPLAEQRGVARRCVLGDFTGQESAEAFAEFVRTLTEDD